MSRECHAYGSYVDIVINTLDLGGAAQAGQAREEKAYTPYSISRTKCYIANIDRNIKAFLSCSANLLALCKSAFNGDKPAAYPTFMEPPEIDQTDVIVPELVKQRSQLWFDIHDEVCVVSSTPIVLSYQYWDAASRTRRRTRSAGAASRTRVYPAFLL